MCPKSWTSWNCLQCSHKYWKSWNLEVGSTCAVWGTAQAAHCGGRQGHTRAHSRGGAHSSTSPQWTFGCKQCTALCTIHNSQLTCRRTQLSKKSVSYPTHILHILISWYVQWSSKDTLLLPYRWQGLGNLRRVSRNCLPSLDAQFQSVDIAHRSRSTRIGHWYFWQQSLRMLGRGAAVFCVAWGGHM